MKKTILLLSLFIISFVLMSTLFAYTASNTIPESGLDIEDHSVTANQVKPQECSGVDLSTIILSGSGDTGNDLLLGSIADDTLEGFSGNDCLVGGDGDDTLDGGDGIDICIGGNGTDTVLNCEAIY